MQLELFDKEDWQIMLEAEEYFDYLQKPHKAFSDMPVCPFIEPEIKKEQLYIDIWNPSKMAFMDMMSKYYDSQKRSALFVCQNSQDIDWEQVERKPIQITLNKKLKEHPLFSEYKCIVLSPWEDFTAGGVSTRKKSPYFMINIGSALHFYKSHKQLQKSSYFANFTDHEKDNLKVS